METFLIEMLHIRSVRKSNVLMCTMHHMRTNIHNMVQRFVEKFRLSCYSQGSKSRFYGNLFDYRIFYDSFKDFSH
jgi:hypothetical protein